MLPNELLNARNRDLRERVSAIQSDINKTRWMTNQDKEEIYTTTEKVNDVRSKLASIQSLVDKTALTLSEEQERTRAYTIEVDKLRKNMIRCGGETKDLAQKLESLEDIFQRKKAQRDAVDEERTTLEQKMVAWAADNAITGQVTQIGANELKIRESNIEALQRDARAKEAAVRGLEEEIWGETLGTDQVNADIRGTKQQIALLEKERKETMDALEQMKCRDKAAQDTYSQILKEKESTEELMRRKEKEKDELKGELAVAEAAVHLTAQAREKAEKQRNTASLTAKQIEHNEKEEEIRCEEMERSLQLMTNELSTLQNQKNHQLSSLAAMREKYSKLDKKVGELKYEVQCSGASSEGTDDRRSQIDRLLGRLREDSLELDNAIIRGKNLEAQQRKIQIQAAKETDIITNELVHLRKQANLSSKTETKLQHSFHELHLADVAITGALEEQQRQLSTEEGMRSGVSVEIRKAHYAHIANQKVVLGELEKTLLKSRAARDEMLGLLRAEGRSLEVIKDLLVSTKKEEDEVSIEIRALAKETEELFIKKQEIWSTTESLFWDVEQQQNILDHHRGSIAEHLQNKAMLKQSIGESEMKIKSEMEGSLVTLHTLQEDYRKMSANLNATTHRITLLKSRHDDLMTILTRKVNANDMDDDSLSKGKSAQNKMLLGNNGLMMITDNTKSSATNMAQQAMVAVEDKLTDLDSTTPEELQARMMIKRALDREILQERGDKLDMEIVKAERELHQLTVATDKLDQTIKQGRDMIIRQGVSYDEVLYGSVCDSASHPLLLTNGGDKDDMALVDQVRAEVDCWDTRLNKLNSLLLQKREQEESVRALCENQRDRLHEAVQKRSALSRQLDELDRVIAKDITETNKTRGAALQKEVQFIKNNPTMVAAAVCGVNPKCGLQKVLRGGKSKNLEVRHDVNEQRKLSDIYARLLDLAIRSSCSGYSQSSAPHADIPTSSNCSVVMTSTVKGSSSDVTGPMSPFFMLHYLADKYGMKELVGVGGTDPTANDPPGDVKSRMPSFRATVTGKKPVEVRGVVMSSSRPISSIQVVGSRKGVITQRQGKMRGTSVSHN